jgi:phage terminase large subunit
MKLEIKHSSIFSKNFESYNSDKRFIVNQGGSRSSKTYSLCQLMIVICLKGKIGVSIVRKSFPSLRGSILRDFIYILKEMNIYNEMSHNKTEQVYNFSNGSWVEFFSSDNEQKLRGRKRDILYCNEGNELGFDEFNQLVMRTTGKVFIDFNPSDTEHWIYDLIKQDNCDLIKSTYKDNPFLTKDQVEYIENLINVDDNYYKIYALGEKPISESRIYSHFKQYNEEINHKDFCYGLDFGYNHPCALVQTWFSGNKVYVKELIYKQKLTTSDLVNEMKNLNLDRSKIIYCDSARPDVIEELRRNGFSKAQLSDKNVKQGIDKVKSMEVYTHFESTNLWKEYRLYSWKTDKDRILDEPIKLNDDGLDAMRYAIYTHHKSVKGVPFFVG